MIYVILYSTVISRKPTRTIGGLYHGLSNSLEGAKKTFDNLVLTPECFRKEIWADDGNGYRRLVMEKRYEGELN